jgi:hypothetical protein
MLHADGQGNAWLDEDDLDEEDNKAGKTAIPAAIDITPSDVSP